MNPHNRPRVVRPLADRLSRSVSRDRAVLGALLACACLAVLPTPASAAVESSATANTPQAATTEAKGSSLESAAAKAGQTGRAVAMSLIGLAFAVAATVLAFR